MAEILRTTPAAMVGKPSFQYLYPEDIDAAQKLFDDKQQGNVHPFHFRLQRDDGSPVWVDVQGTPMHSVGGEFIGIVGTFAVSPDQF